MKELLEYTNKVRSEADLRLLQHPRWSTNYYHKAPHLGCCSSPRSASEDDKMSKPMAHDKSLKMICKPT